MKKIYLTLLALGMFSISNAQLSLTKAANEPVVGDSNTQSGFDSVGVVPKTIGAGQTWNFSAFAQNTVVSQSIYQSTTSVGSATAFPGTTMVESDGQGSYTMWKSANTPTTQLELLGINDTGSGAMITFTNSGVVAVWPATYLSSFSDTYAGTAALGGTLTGPATGTINTQGSGTGTLTIPGGTSFSNILQVRITQTMNISIGSGLGAITINMKNTDYQYYHSSQKFPLMTVSYQKQTMSSIAGPTVTSSVEIKLNNNLLAGLNEENFDATFQIFPNPAKDNFSVNLTNSSLENGNIEIYNSIGQLVKTINLGNDANINTNISIGELNSGIYVVKTTLGKRSSSRKLIIE